MSFPGFSALWAAWFFLLFIPLVLFYFLKLKRPRMEIPSLALWRQVINDRRVNSPFQKFKRNLLLLLQLLLLLFLVLAAMQPFVRSGDERAEYLPVLIDCSASMGALDQPEGQTRLEAARQEVGKLIDDLLPDQQLSLIAVHSTARRLTDFTNNKRLLHKALDDLAVVDVPSKLEDALRMTQALARTKSISKVIIYSDGNFPPQVDFELPFELNYQQLPPGGSNIGITEFNARRAEVDLWDVFVRVAGTTHLQTAGDIEVLQNGQSVGVETVVLENGKSQRLVFRVEAAAATSLEARLKPDGFDSLASDNVAYLDLPAGRSLKVYASPELVTYRHALKALKGVELLPADGDEGEGEGERGRRGEGENKNGDGRAGGVSPLVPGNQPVEKSFSGGATPRGQLATDSGPYDVVVTDQQGDDVPEAAISLFVGVIPRDLEKSISVRTGLADIVDWERSSPLLQHVQLAGVQIADEPVAAANVGAGDLEQLGYEVLAHARTGPLILQKRSGATLQFYLLFHTDRSTLPYRVAFPLLVANVVQIALQQAALSEVRGFETEVLPPMSLAADRAYRVTAPDGTRLDVHSDDDGAVSGVPAPLVGRYAFNEDGTEVATVGVSLLDEGETSLADVKEIQFRELSVAAAGTTLKSDRPLWQAFAWLAFGLLLVEWWYFQRRPGGLST